MGSERAVVVAVAVGGAVGAVLRAAVGDLAPATGGVFPWTTFWVNVSGSALLALLTAVAAVRRHRLLGPLFGTGVLGGFTTLSAWSGETHHLLADGEVAVAAAYAGGTLLACLAAIGLVDRLSRGRRHAGASARGDR